MGYGITNDSYYPAIASAIREKAGTSSIYTPSEMAPAITAIEAGGMDPIEAIAAYPRDEISIVSGDFSTVASCAFTSCRSLTAVDLPNCETIGISAFYYCSSLATVNLPKCKSIGTGAFERCSNVRLKTINLPNCETIETNAFYYCRFLSTISLPKCTHLGYAALEYCDSLKTIDLPNCETISRSAFRYCASISTVSLPKCNSIGDSAFYDCRRLSMLNLWSVSSVTTLGLNVFRSTPIGGYSTYNNNRFGSVYVPASLLNSFKTATNWASISSRIVGY